MTAAADAETEGCCKGFAREKTVKAMEWSRGFFKWKITQLKKAEI